MNRVEGEKKKTCPPSNCFFFPPSEILTHAYLLFFSSHLPLVLLSPHPLIHRLPPQFLFPLHSFRERGRIDVSEMTEELDNETERKKKPWSDRAIDRLGGLKVWWRVSVSNFSSGSGSNSNSVLFSTRYASPSTSTRKKIEKTANVFRFLPCHI